MDMPNKKDLVGQSTGDSSKIVKEKVSAVKKASLEFSSKVCTVVVAKNMELKNILLLMDMYIVDNLMVSSNMDLDT